jgi:hypothetical protein
VLDVNERRVALTEADDRSLVRDREELAIALQEARAGTQTRGRG